MWTTMRRTETSLQPGLGRLFTFDPGASPARGDGRFQMFGSSLHSLTEPPALC